MSERVWDWNLIHKYGEFKESDLVLETGAMFSTFSRSLIPYGCKITATDSWGWAGRDKMEQTADAWVEQITKDSSITVEQADMQNLPYADKTFDKVVCISAIEHVDDDVLALYEMMRVLKPEGLLLLTTEFNPDRAYRVDDPDGSFYRVYDKVGISTLLGTYTLQESRIAPFVKDFTTIFLVLRRTHNALVR